MNIGSQLRDFWRATTTAPTAAKPAATDITVTRRTKWANIRFHGAVPPKVPEHLLEHVARVYKLQEADSARFAAARPGLLARLRPDRQATIAMNCDERFVALFENWAASCDHAGINTRDCTLVFTTDLQAKQRVEALGYVAYLDEDSELLASLGDSETYGDIAWCQYMFHQNWVIKQLLMFDTDVLFQDVDLVWTRDPVELLHGQADDGAAIQAIYDGPNGRFQPLYANSGFMYFRPTQQVRSFWDQVYAEHRWVAYYRSQQEPLNVLLAAYAHRGLDVRILEEDIFANGHLYCGNRTAPDDPWITHMSWTANLEEKLERYRAFNLWFLD